VSVESVRRTAPALAAADLAAWFGAAANGHHGVGSDLWCRTC